MISRRLVIFLWVIAILMSLLLFCLNLFFGDINQDEGWYLYAVRLVSQGELPYIDFASTQGPVMPFVYLLAQPLVDNYGLAGGRLFTGLLGFICSLCAAWLASRLVNEGRKGRVAVMALFFIGVNVYQSYFFTIVKTYALGSLLLVLGFLVLTFAWGRYGVIAAFFSGVLLSLATGTRISAGAVIPVIFLSLLIYEMKERKRAVSDRSWRNSFLWIWFGVGAVLTCFLLFGPFLFKAPHALWFALVEYHSGRHTGGLFSIFGYKAGFILRVIRAYFVPIGLFMFVLAYTLAKRICGENILKKDKSGSSMQCICEACLWVSTAVVTLVHFCAPFPYDDYQVLIYPVFAVALSVMLFRFCYSQSRKEICLLLTVFFLCTASALSSTIVQKWFIGKHDRIWWPLKKETPLAKLQSVGRLIRSISNASDILLTQDPYLAVESGLRLPDGLELGPFSYFPDWSNEKASENHVLNREMFIKLLETSEAQVAAFSGYGLVIRLPDVTELSRDEQHELWQILDKRYSLFREIDDFGQAETTLKIFLISEK